MSPTVLVVMGVSGSGKSTVAAVLAGRLGWPFEEGDDLHPKANVDKMAAGHPLDDDDRWPWLRLIRGWIDERLDAGESGIVACSALKHAYRDVLRRDGVVFVLLDGAREDIAARLAKRQGHFMPPTLLDSQFADLERPGDDENAIVVDLGRPAAVQAGEVVDTLGLATS